MIIVIWNKSSVAVEVKLVVWICYRLFNSFDAVFLHDIFPQPFCRRLDSSSRH